MFGDKERSKN